MDLPPGFRFVEILSADAKLAAIVWTDDGDVVKVARAKEPECMNYAQAFGIECARIVELAPGAAAE